MLAHPCIHSVPGPTSTHTRSQLILCGVGIPLPSPLSSGSRALLQGLDTASLVDCSLDVGLFDREAPPGGLSVICGQAEIPGVKVTPEYLCHRQHPKPGQPREAHHFKIIMRHKPSEQETLQIRKL